jgi:hypothetical protein
LHRNRSRAICFAAITIRSHASPTSVRAVCSFITALPVSLFFEEGQFPIPSAPFPHSGPELFSAACVQTITAATSVSLSRVSPTPPALSGRGLLCPMVTSEMRNGCERTNEEWPPLADAFREIHRFILKAVDGNAAAASALFQRYLNGELPDELLRISRSWVQEEQACAPSRSQGESIGVADPQAGEHLTPVRPVERRRLRRAGERRRRRPHLQGTGGATGSPLDVGESRS